MPVASSAPRSQRLWPVLALAVLACLLVVPAASSRVDGPGQGNAVGSFGESVDVVVLEVEAVVTDGQGRRVHGLEPEDFRLLVDGREVPVEYFAEVRDGEAAAVAGPGSAGQAEATGALPEPSAPVVTNYLVFIDDYFGIGSRRDWMLDRIARQVDALPPQDRVAVVAYDGERIEILADWSSPRAQLPQVLLAAKERPAGGLLRANEWQRRAFAPERGAFNASAAAIAATDRFGTPTLVNPTLTRALVNGPIAETDRLLTDPFHDRWAQDLELSRELTALQATLRVMPRPEGRRVLFLLAGGWPDGARSTSVLRPGESNTLLSLPEGYGRTAPLDDLAMVQPLIDTANLLGYTVYPADMNGFRPAPQVDEVARQNTLRKIAAGTGGRALLFDQRASSLTQVVEDTRTYYSLGITPALDRDNTYHDIRVEVRPPAGSGRLHVRSRAGYRDFSRATELDFLAASALQLGGGPVPSDTSSAGSAGTRAENAPEALSVSLGTPERRPRRTMKVPLSVDVPWSQITVLPAGAGSAGHLEIRVAARDRDGALSEVATVPLKLSFEDSTAPEGSLHWESDLLLRRERNDLVVSVYDALSGRVMTRVVTAAP